MNKIPLFVAILFSLCLLAYASLPNPDFPSPPPDSVQSDEPADTESILRRAYFTNITREEVISHYESEFNKQINLPTLRLNYQPEESQTIIRDQTKSTFLEELVHPFRESIFINGFEPKTEKDTIIISGVHWRQKIIVKYLPSNSIYRVIVTFLTGVSVYLLWREYKNAIKN